jgi:hypothetical protein
VFGDQRGEPQTRLEPRRRDRRGGQTVRRLDIGATTIDLNYVNRDEAASGGSRLAQIASFRFADGRIAARGGRVVERDCLTAVSSRSHGCYGKMP